MDFGSLHKNFSSEPEAFEFGGEGIGEALTVVRVLTRGFVGAERFVNGEVLFAHGRSLGLGGVRGEDGFDVDFFQRSEGVVFAEAIFGEAADDGGPESFDGGGSVFGATLAAELPGDAFFDDIEELEGDGEELGAGAFFAFLDFARVGLVILPWDEGAEFRVAGEGLGEEAHGVGEGLVEFAESFLEIGAGLDGVGHARM